MKKLILLSGSPCVGKTTVGQYLFAQCDNSAYLDFSYLLKDLIKVLSELFYILFGGAGFSDLLK